MIDINKWKVRWDKENYIPKKIYGGKKTKGLIKIFKDKGIF